MFHVRHVHVHVLVQAMRHAGLKGRLAAVMQVVQTGIICCVALDSG